MAPIKIDKSKPMPEPDGRQAPFNYPWDDMAVGDSFFVPLGIKQEHGRDERQRRKAKVWIAVQWRKKHHPGENYTTRAEADGLRVWRSE